MTRPPGTAAWLPARLGRAAREEILYWAACSAHRLGPGRGLGRAKVLVNGTPRTGTTWMSWMLAALPGHRFVGNFQRDRRRYAEMRPGDVAHGHERRDEDLECELGAAGVRVVVLVRDPRDQTVSRLFHIRRDPQHRDHRRLREQSLEEGLLACIAGRDGGPIGVGASVAISRSWLRAESASAVVRYETLVQGAGAELLRVVAALGLGTPPSLVRRIAERHRFERLTRGRRVWRSGRAPGEEDRTSHFRKGLIGDWRNHFGPAHVALFKEVAGDLLIELGYERSLDW